MEHTGRQRGVACEDLAADTVGEVVERPATSLAGGCGVVAAGVGAHANDGAGKVPERVLACPCRMLHKNTGGNARRTGCPELDAAIFAAAQHAEG